MLLITLAVQNYLLLILRDDLRDRALLNEFWVGQWRNMVTFGATQGSILGFDIWNLSYDGLIRIKMNDESHLVEYPNNYPELVTARSIMQAKLILGMMKR